MLEKDLVEKELTQLERYLKDSRPAEVNGVTKAVHAVLAVLRQFHHAALKSLGGEEEAACMAPALCHRTLHAGRCRRLPAAMVAALLASGASRPCCRPAALQETQSLVTSQTRLPLSCL